MKKGRLYLFCVVVLVIVGIVMIYSASQVWCRYKMNNEYYYLIRQGIYATIGGVLFVVTTKMNLDIVYRYTNKFFIFSIILMILVLIPGIGVVRGGARSWIGFGMFTIQPSEVFKLASILYTARVLSKNDGLMRSNRAFYLYTMMMLALFILILLQPDFGSGIVILLGIMLMLFVSGIQLKNIILAIILGVVGIGVMVYVAPYRLTRIYSYLDPWSDPLGSGFQIIQSMYAIAPSGLFGLGLFNSRQKYFYLPEPQNDFIFAILVEELGIIGGIVVLSLFFIIIIIGLRVGLCARGLYEGYLAIGITSSLFVQISINICVVIGLIPCTGVTLPLISYGGSSLCITIVMLGLIYNIITKRELSYKFDL